MQFTLTYSGPLHSTGNASSKADHKQDIREHLRPQLKELWTHDPLSWHQNYLMRDPPDGEISVLIERGGNWYAPLVAKPLHLLAELDVLLLRPERPGRIITSGGDIDNRLKTLLDSLSAPTEQQSALPPGSAPADNPFFTLLEDDDLVKRVNIDTDRRLSPPASNEVHVTIRVTLRASRLIHGNVNLIN